MFFRTLFAVCLLVPAAAFAETAYAVDSRSILLSFDTAVPGFVTSVNLIRGLQPGEGIIGIDFRPANKRLYGLSSASRLYTIDPGTGIATVVGNGQPFTPALDGTEVGFDFNPTVDRIRITTNRGQNLRLHPDTGMIVAVDRPLNYANDSSGAVPAMIGGAYTNSVPNATSTLLYGIDTRRMALVTQNPPNDGVINVVGPLVNFNTSDLAGFDISPNTGRAFAALRPTDSQRAMLFEIHLPTGDHNPIGPLALFEQLSGFAIAPR
jgi:hypothetical protein